MSGLTYQIITSEGTMDDLIKVLNSRQEEGRSESVVYIEPIILKGANSVERYGYRILFRKEPNPNANSIPAPK